MGYKDFTFIDPESNKKMLVVLGDVDTFEPAPDFGPLSAEEVSLSLWHAESEDSHIDWQSEIITEEAYLLDITLRDGQLETLRTINPRADAKPTGKAVKNEEIAALTELSLRLSKVEGESTFFALYEPLDSALYVLDIVKLGGIGLGDRTHANRYSILESFLPDNAYSSRVARYIAAPRKKKRGADNTLAREAFDEGHWLLAVNLNSMHDSKEPHFMLVNPIHTLYCRVLSKEKLTDTSHYTRYRYGLGLLDIENNEDVLAQFLTSSLDAEPDDVLEVASYQPVPFIEGGKTAIDDSWAIRRKIDDDFSQSKSGAMLVSPRIFGEIE